MDSEDMLQPGVNIKPVINVDEIKKLVRDVYSFTVLKVTELNGYDDNNYHIIVENSDEGNSIIGKPVEEGYVLKIINSLDSKKPQFFEAQNEVLLHLGKKGILCPKPVPTKEGLYFTKTTLASGEHIVRLLEFIEGSVLERIPCTPKLLFQIGKYAAELNQALQDFHHPAYDNHKSMWMLQSLPKIRHFIFAVTDKNNKKLVLEVINEFENRVLPQVNTLEKGLIHGDVNEQNIIVEEQNGEWKFKTLIDFGDSHIACYLFELAVNMTYMIVYSKDIDSGGHILAGYSSVRRVPDKEFELLKVCVTGRLCQSLVMGAYSNLQNPENLYVLRTSINGWKMLEEMWNQPESELLARWKAIAQNGQYF